MVGNQIVPSSPLIRDREVKKERPMSIIPFEWKKRRNLSSKLRTKDFFRMSDLVRKNWQAIYIHYVSSQLWLGVKSFLNEVDRFKSKNTLTGKEKDGFYTIRYVCQRFDDSRRSGWKFQFNWQSTILMENEIKWFF